MLKKIIRVLKVDLFTGCQDRQIHHGTRLELGNTYLRNADRKSARNFVNKSVIEPNCLKVISASAVEEGVDASTVELLFSTDFLAGNVFDLLICSLLLSDGSSAFSYTDWQLAIDPRFPYFFKESK